MTANERDRWAISQALECAGEFDADLRVEIPAGDTELFRINQAFPLRVIRDDDELQELSHYLSGMIGPAYEADRPLSDAERRYSNLANELIRYYGRSTSGMRL